MARGAQVKVLPPLLYVVPLLLAWALERVLPTSVGLGPAGAWLGGLLVVAGLALMVWAFVTFRRWRTTVIPWGRVSAVAVDGPYRFTRNPIYLGDALAYVGASVWLDSLLAVSVLPVILAATYRLVIRHEEAYLAGQFGAAYTAYRRRVRRWV